MLSAAEMAAMNAVVASSLDQSLPLYRKVVTQDGYGHTSETYPGTPTLMLICNIVKPSATDLATYAGLIAGKKSLMLRYMPTQDVREGDRIVYQGSNWEVQPTESAESYTFADEVLITVVV